MGVKNEAFIAIEEQLAAKLFEEWQRSTVEVRREIRAALEAERFEDAHDLVSELTFDEVCENLQPFIERMVYTAILFGVSQADENVPLDISSNGDLDSIVPLAVRGLSSQLCLVATARLQDLLHRAIESERNEDKQGLLFDPFKIIKAADVPLAERLNAAVAGTGKQLIDIGANLTTSRLSSYGFMYEANRQGATSYQISEILDKRTCPFCQGIHGKIFKLAPAKDRMESILRVQDPNELKTLAPFPPQKIADINAYADMSNAELQALGYDVPPFHPRCRGLLQKRGSVHGPAGKFIRRVGRLAVDAVVDTAIEALVDAVSERIFPHTSRPVPDSVPDAIGDVAGAVLIDELIDGIRKPRAAKKLKLERHPITQKAHDSGDGAYAFGHDPTGAYKGNPLLRDLAHEQGFDDLPTVVPREQLDELVGKGWVEVYRGVDGPQAAEFVSDFKVGEFYAGRGIHGGGTYTITSRQTALKFASGNEGMLRMAISPGARTITQADLTDLIHTNLGELEDRISDVLKRRAAAFDAGTLTDELAASLELETQLIHAERRIMSDPGQAATVLGFDAIDTGYQGIWVVLNRSAVAVMGDPY